MANYNKYVSYKIERATFTTSIPGAPAYTGIYTDYKGKTTYIHNNSFMISRKTYNNDGKETSSTFVAGPFSSYDEAAEELENVKSAYQSDDLVFSGVASDDESDFNYKQSQDRSKEEWWTSQAQSQASRDISNYTTENGTYGSNWNAAKSKLRSQYGI